MQAGDIDELLNPGYPVYFNYAGISLEKTPSSLVVIKHCMLVAWTMEESSYKSQTPSLAAWVILISNPYSLHAIVLIACSIKEPLLL